MQLLHDVHCVQVSPANNIEHCRGILQGFFSCSVNRWDKNFVVAWYVLVLFEEHWRVGSAASDGSGHEQLRRRVWFWLPQFLKISFNSKMIHYNYLFNLPSTHRPVGPLTPVTFDWTVERIFTYYSSFRTRAYFFTVFFSNTPFLKNKILE